ncbi:flagellar basal-body MS-ring/collar protein FliF [Variovorax sp. OV329]|uniref:flagellar basal-body MS-ring/collar protein FliF n=1 Tax=Variovorax sp. OV329 TaxID=1882825 RepID=UPI0008F2311D|nr:flagellar basal-body MS-ring/collar protein FliF [Variovorax sp. OV329]SFM65505.1 flagellar M-ring protein FliF [Variovorax sp. OV329]
MSAATTAAPVPALPTGAPVSGLPTALPFVERLRAQPKLPMILGGAALVAALAAFVLWNRAPDYKVLYANVTERDGGAIIASLSQMNVPYKFAEGGGAIMVPADKVPELRLKLASQGLPKGGGVGFELMDNQKFGTSQFTEQVNYQRALEGELVRSIESIGTVEAARVHLALPKPSLFVREQKKPSASVVLTLQRGRSIDEGQVSAIVHMISSSVPDLDAKSVTVVDQRGNLLSAANSGARGLDVSQLKFAQEIEQTYVRRIESILQPILGAGNVRAQVAADIDFTVVEHTDEKFRPNDDPKAKAVRSQQSSESAQQGGTPPGGVPGALTNQPPTNPSAPISTAAAPNAPGKPGAPGAPGAAAPAAQTASSTASSGPSNSRKDSTTNYELDRSIRHVQQGAGGVKRLSVAVVVNNREGAGTEGKPASTALTAAELDQIRNLVKEAMGFSQERGDSLNVVNSSFIQEREPVPVELPLWKDPQAIELGKSIGQYALIALVVLVLWLSFLRPRKRKQQELLPAADGAPSLPPAEQAALQEQQQQDAREQLRLRESERQRVDLEYAQQLAQEDPRLVAALIKHWMTPHE